MGTMILISSVAILVGIVGCAVIWRMDASRADEIERQPPNLDGPDDRAPGEWRRLDHGAPGAELPPSRSRDD
ncbi:hypothetical protein [Nocardioides currus]|uniref:hypothetical protein n=1 Tax=Nocardioides currus TaxID=2133958 RepID=UPI001401E70F|nr:hypothetical protein [Nocardioides currus]